MSFEQKFSPGILGKSLSVPKVYVTEPRGFWNKV